MSDTVEIPRVLLDRLSTALSFAQAFMSGFVGDDTQEMPVSHTVDEIGALEQEVDTLLVPLPGEAEFIVSVEFINEDTNRFNEALRLHAVNATAAEKKGREIIDRFYGEVEFTKLDVTEIKGAK